MATDKPRSRHSSLSLQRFDEEAGPTAERRHSHRLDADPEDLNECTKKVKSMLARCNDRKGREARRGAWLNNPNPTEEAPTIFDLELFQEMAEELDRREREESPLRHSNNVVLLASVATTADMDDGADWGDNDTVTQDAESAYA